MSEVAKKRRPRRRRPQYQHHPMASSVTIYSPDGSPVPEFVLRQLEAHAELLALDNNLLVSVNRASS
jgi:hypothetical protein